MTIRRLILPILVLCLGLCWLPGAAASADAPEYEAYVVHENQTLDAIAAEYGLPVEYLAQFNQIDAKGALKAGQVVMVPVLSQLAPQAAAYAKTDAAAPAGEQITGVLGTVSAARTQILSKPNGGRLLFDKAVRGTELLVIGQTDTHYAVLMSDGSTGFVAKTALALSQTRINVSKPTAPAPTDTGGQNDFVDLALHYLGTPYRYGGTLPDSVDCSLLIQTVFARKGIKLPRTAAQQFTVGTPVPVGEKRPEWER